uniref:Uncharacterized protein n=1 Tax=Glossina pallidipes TaxID=7398 RepID=A0A1B0A253_GLOPL
MNSDWLKRVQGSYVYSVDASMQSLPIIFEISYPSNELFLLICLQKVLQGDIKDSAEPYIKADQHTDSRNTCISFWGFRKSQEPVNLRTSIDNNSGKPVAVVVNINIARSVTQKEKRSSLIMSSHIGILVAIGMSLLLISWNHAESVAGDSKY